mgnify:CR=1 FL=1
MSITFSNATEVFIFIMFCSVYVCSTLWIYGDAATRDMGLKGLALPFVFIFAAVLALLDSFIYELTGLQLGYWPLCVWPVGYIAWFILRPSQSHVITE